MTADEFVAAYVAESQGVTAEDLRRFGRYPEPCECGDQNCQGWRMGHQHEDALFEDHQRSVGVVPGTSRLETYLADASASLLGDLGRFKPVGVQPFKLWPDGDPGTSMLPGESDEPSPGMRELNLVVHKASAMVPVSRALLDDIYGVNRGDHRPPWQPSIRSLSPRRRLRWWWNERRAAAARKLFTMVSGEQFPDDYDPDD